MNWTIDLFRSKRTTTRACQPCAAAGHTKPFKPNQMQAYLPDYKGDPDTSLKRTKTDELRDYVRTERATVAGIPVSANRAEICPSNSVY